MSTEFTAPPERIVAMLREEVSYRHLVEECRIHLQNIIEQFWDVGRRIALFLDDSTHRSRYGRRVYLTLSEDLDINVSTLYASVQLYRADPMKRYLDQLARLPWWKVKRLLPLLRKREDVQEEIARQLDELESMSPNDFLSWLPSAHEEITGEPMERRRRSGEDNIGKNDEDMPADDIPISEEGASEQTEERDVEAQLESAVLRAIEYLSGLTDKGPLPCAIQSVDDTGGFVAVVSWTTEADPDATIAFLEQLIDRISTQNAQDEKREEEAK